jgi:hypothetical protein
MLTNHSDQLQPATVRLAIDGQSVGSRSVAIEPGQTHEVAFAQRVDRPGMRRVIFSLTGDGLGIDDNAYLVSRGVEQTRVVLVTDDDTNAIGTAGYFLARALAPRGDAADRFVVEVLHSVDASADGLRKAAAVFVGPTGILSEQRLQDLLAYVESGGGAVFFCGEASAAANLRALDRLRPDGVLPWRPGSSRGSHDSSAALSITAGDWRSALLAGFGESARLSLADVRIYGAWTGVEDRDADTLLGFSDGTPALTWRPVGAGRLAVANFSADERHSDLGKYGVFVALMQGLADVVQTTRPADHDNTVGRPIYLQTDLAIDSSGPPPLVVGPTGPTPIDGVLSRGDLPSSVVIIEPDKAGFYTANQGETVLATVAVNTDPRESDLRRTSADAVARALRTLDEGNIAVSPGGDSSLARRSRDLWGWLLVLAFVCLGAEMGMLGVWRQ